MLQIRADRLLERVANQYRTHAVVLVEQGAIAAVETRADKR
jgi:hypothetical protein